MSLHYSDNSTYLERLPPELQCQILKNLPDMKSLHALLRASPRYFQVYRASQGTILSHVGWNHISPAIVPIALQALRQRNGNLRGSNRIRPFPPQTTLKEPNEISFKIWKKLLRFHVIVENFISKFTSSRLVPLENSFHLQTKSSLPHEASGRRLSLSQLEYARLARAFYNLDLYGNSSDDNDIVPCFLHRLQDWELEELLCVRSFLMERLKDFLNKFDDDFMEAFLKDMPHIIWPPEKTPVWFSEIGLLSNRGRPWLQDSWIEGYLTRGLKTLSAIFSTDTLPDKFRVFENRRRIGYLTTQAYIFQALNDIPIPSEQELAAKMKSAEIGFYDDLEEPNEAWFWAMKVGGHPRNQSKGVPCAGWDTNNLQCWGYVIWDHERLKRLGILTKR